jgi:hypothetical protein
MTREGLRNRLEGLDWIRLQRPSEASHVRGSSADPRRNPPRLTDKSTQVGMGWRHKRSIRATGYTLNFVLRCMVERRDQEDLIPRSVQEWTWGRAN